MTETIEKYLTLRGANNDIYFFQKRVSEKVADIIGTSFVKTSLRTKDLNEAISSRDDLVDALNELENSDSDNEFVYNYFRPESMDDILRFKNKWQLMNDLEELDSTKRYPSEECNCSTGVDKFNDMCL